MSTVAVVLLGEGRLPTDGPELLLLLNPVFEPGQSIDQLVVHGVLHEDFDHISPVNTRGNDIGQVAFASASGDRGSLKEQAKSATAKYRDLPPHQAHLCLYHR